MKTSYFQYLTMVEFMEANGDLSKPSGGPRGRHFVQMKWKELANKLNSDGTGDPKTEEKWRKVWSDFKNNCKKKCAKINRAARGTGGGPAFRLSLTDLENRVMQIIGMQAAVGMVMEEAGFPMVEVTELGLGTQHNRSGSGFVWELNDSDWNTPGTSSQPVSQLDEAPALSPSATATSAASPSAPAARSAPINTPAPSAPINPPASTADEEWVAPPTKQRRQNLAKLFMDADEKAREYARERERVYDELERERLRIRNEEIRVRELEVQERIRQRDRELQLNAEWLEFMKEALNVFVRFKKD